MVKSFKLHGTEWKVERCDNVSIDSGEGHTKDVYGLCDYHKNTIEVAKKIGTSTLSKDVQEKTFYHELMHTILTEASYDELSADEDFVERISGLLHQYMKTKEG